ncbi:MAG TPA: hypothetical protein VF057_02340 [Thermoanaerobaculia bacterium]
MRALLLIAVALVAFPSFAQDLTGFEKVLLPLDPTVIVSGTQQYLTFLGVAPDESPVRFFPDGNAGVNAVQPHLLPQNLAASSVSNGAGRLIYLERFVPMSLVLRAAPDISDPHGALTSMPVVRERNFLQGPVTFPNVPFLFDHNAATLRSTPVHRIKLHVFDVDITGQMQVRIESRSLSGGRTDEQFASVRSRNGNDPSFPYYAEVAVTPICAPVSTRINCLDGQGVISVTPAESIADPPRLFRYYAFVSMVDVRTGVVTLITP